MTLWVDVVARARGLRTHRLRPATFNALRAAPDLRALARALAQAGFPVEEGEHRIPGLDLAVRRRAASELRILARWCGERAAELPVIFEDEDRRSLRAVIRGALQHQPAEVRLRGLVPTPTLPERALSELAGAPTPAGVATLLTVWNHPFGAALRKPAAATAPDPLTLDLALDRAWAARAVDGARHGGKELVLFVADAIDLANGATALSLAGTPPTAPMAATAATAATTPARAADLYLEGGLRLARTAFTALLARNRAAVSQVLSDLFHGTPYAALFRRAPLRGLEDALLLARLDAQRQAARRAPLGVAPILWYALELRAESTALSRLIWALALGAPVDA